MPTGRTSRKSHNKTRTGCQTCKKRKIKCDESRPSCQNCIKHDVQCDFKFTYHKRSRSSSTQAMILDAHSSTNDLEGCEYTLRHHVSQRLPLNDLASPALPVAELKLLHNFCCFTCYTFSSNIVLKNVWRINVPELGFAHEFVMRGILALSALHLAHTNTVKREHYFEQAATHQQAALDVVLPLLNKVTTENCLGAYIFSVQTVIYALARPRNLGDLLLLENAEAVPDWLSLLRGTKSIIQLYATTLHASPLAPMFHIGRHRSEQRNTATSKERHLEELRAQILETMDNSAAETYAETIDELQKTFAVICNISEGSYEFNATTADLYDVFTWPYSISDEYLIYLQQLAPAALAILAHFCILLKALDAHWWMQGWSTHLISTIFSLLDIEYRLWIQWPMEEIGWNPNRS